MALMALIMSLLDIQSGTNESNNDTNESNNGTNDFNNDTNDSNNVTTWPIKRY